MLLAFLNREDHAAVILATGLAGAVRQMVSAAVRALHYCGRLQLPHGRTPLIAALAGYFTLRDCHELHLPQSAVCEQLCYLKIFEPETEGSL